MTVFTFSVLLFVISILAGLLGALTGLGGGIIVIPALVLLFDINIHYAMGAALISVIATSSGTSVAYLKQGIANMRIGMFLECAAVVGALIGALTLPYLPKTFIEILFALILLYSAYITILHKQQNTKLVDSHPWAYTLKLHGSYPLNGRRHRYNVQHVPLAFGIMGIAGLLSGLLGIGSGSVKVLAMDQALGLPYKVATTTSNFMIGITAAVSAGVYFSHGFIIPEMVFPVLLGVLAGSFIGAKILTYIHSAWLRIIFSIAICFIAIQMLYNAI